MSVCITFFRRRVLKNAVISKRNNEYKKIHDIFFRFVGFEIIHFEKIYFLNVLVTTVTFLNHFQ